MCLIFLIKYSNFKGKTNWHARQEAVKLRLRESEDIEFPHFIQLSCFTKCHRLPRHVAILASTPTVSRGFLQLNISEWDFLHNQRKALGRWQGGEGIIIFHFIFIIFIYSKKFGTSLIFSSDNFREYLMISPRGSQDIGSCQNWIKEKWSEVFPSFETKIHIWRAQGMNMTE